MEKGLLQMALSLGHIRMVSHSCIVWVHLAYELGELEVAFIHVHMYLYR